MFDLKRAGVVLAGLLLTLLVACSGGSDSPSAGPPQGPDGPDVAASQIGLETSLATTYYHVFGLTTEAIFDDIETNGPKDDQGRLGSGLTSVVWGYNWTGDRRGDGSCSIRNMTIRADMTIELPAHIHEEDLSDSTRENWREYADGVAQHEQRHVDIYLAGAEDIRAEMETIGVEEDCEILEETIKSIWADQQGRINGLQEIFHNEEDLRLATQRDPLERSIDDNRARLAELQAEIAGLDDLLASLNAEITTIDLQVDSIEAQIQQINQQFPSDLPQSVRDRLESLIAENNSLLVEYNLIVDEHNGVLAQRNSLAGEYQQLLDATNLLVDEFNWAR